MPNVVSVVQIQIRADPEALLRSEPVELYLFALDPDPEHMENFNMQFI